MPRTILSILLASALATLGGETVAAAPEQAQEQVDRGIELYQAGQYKDAEQVLQEAVSVAPEDVRARYYLGLALLGRGRNKDAVDEFLRAKEALSELESAPSRDQIEVGLARAYLERKEYEKARESLDEAEALNASNPDVYLYRGKLHVQRGNYIAAVGELEKALELAAEDPYAHYYAGIAYSNIKRPDKMVDHFQMFLKLAPDAPEAAKVRSLLRSVR
ncbi:MAG: tetratricopeptide repeat protein [Acidobacteria bacterium]|nr:tetratricopeptide repeat protein [Acidobacteriota bacterium]